MSFIAIVLDYLFKPQGSQTFYVERALGYLLLMIAGGVGLFFLFHSLIPFLGYIGSGFLIFGILAGSGLGLLYVSQQKKKERPIDTLLEQVQENLKGTEINLDQVISNNIPKTLITCFIAGLALSEVVDFIKETKKKS